MNRPAIGPLLGAGKEAEAFEYGAHVLKLYRAGRGRAIAFAEAAILAIVGDHPLPALAIYEAGQFDGRWGLVMGRAAGPSLAEQGTADPARLPALLAAMVDLHLAVHACTEQRLSPLKRRLADRIGRAPGSEPHRDLLLARLAALPDGDRICHGDFHPLNLIGPPDALTIVDWPDATSGPPAADACRTHLLLLSRAPDLAAAYLASYAARSGIPEAAILAWQPILAAARLCENVPEEEAMLRRLAAAVS